MVVTLSTSSCFRSFYATGTRERPTPADVQSIDLAHKKVILHLDDTILMMKDMRLTDTVLTGKPGQLFEPYTKFTNPVKKRTNKYKRKNKTIMENQVHMYARLPHSGLAPKEDSMVNVPLGLVYRIDQYKHNKDATTLNYIVSTVGVVALAVVAVFSVAFIISPPVFF